MTEGKNSFSGKSALADIDVLILAGGMGTRLRSVVPDLQKVLVEVGDTPFLEFIINQVCEFGAKRIILAVGHKSEQVRDWLSKRNDTRDLEILLSVEEEPLGTGGALRNSVDMLRSNLVMVLNGDSYADVDIGALVSMQDTCGADVALIAVEVPDISRYGSLVIEESGAVISFAEKCNKTDPPVFGLVNSGIYLMRRAVIEKIQPDTRISLEEDVLPKYCLRGLFALPQKVPFLDIGTPETWRESEQFFNELETKEPAS